MFRIINWLLKKKSKSYNTKLLACIIVVFILSRFLFWWVGINFYSWEGRQQMQFVDPEILKNNLFQSVLYLHGQPPLFQFFVGLIYKLFPENNVIVFHLIFFILGLALIISLFLLMTKLEIASKLSAILTILFMISPSAILYENLLLYTYFVAAFLCLSAIVLYKFLNSGLLRYGILFFTFLSIIVLVRSLYHFFWFMMFFFILLIFQRYEWKKIILISFFPFLLIFLSYAKNAYFFGSFTGSTWFGMSFCKMTTFMLSEDERIQLIKHGKISELSLLPSFRGIWYYRNHMSLSEFKKTNIPVLDLENYPNTFNNYNNLKYISLSKLYGKDAIYVLKTYPYVYLKSLLKSFRCFFFPSSDYFALFSEINFNRKKISYLVRFYNFVFYGQLLNIKDSSFNEEYDSWKDYSQSISKIGFSIVIGFFISLFYGIFLAFKNFLYKPVKKPFMLTILFLVLNIMYVALVGNLFEVGENHRFRFMIDPFILIILGLFINSGLKKLYIYKVKHHA